MGRVFKRGETYWIGYRIPGERDERRESARTQDRREAKALLQERLEDVRAGRTRTDQTVNMLLDRLLADHRMNARKSIKETECHVLPVRASFGTARAEDVNMDRLRAYVGERQEKGRANATINRELSCLRRAFTLGRQAGVVREVPPFPSLRENNIRQGTFTREEIDRLCAYLPEHLRSVVLFAYYTGRRRGEILQIEWTDVHLEEGYIRIRQSTTKTGEPDTIPLIGNLRTLMDELSESRTAGLTNIFHYQGQPLKSFYAIWRNALTKAGLKDKLFHDLRRTVATDLIEAGVPEVVAMRVTGHKTRATFERYNIVRSEAVKEAMHGLAEFRQRDK